MIKVDMSNENPIQQKVYEVEKFKNFEQFKADLIEKVKLFEEEFSKKQLEVQHEEVSRIKENDFFYFIKPYFIALTGRGFQLSSIEENEKLLNYLKNFEQESGLSILDTELAHYVALWLYKKDYNEEKLLELGFKTNNLSFWSGLIAENGEKLNLESKSDDEIVGLGKKIIRNYFKGVYTRQNIKENFEEFELGMEPHAGHLIWDEFVKFLKLEGDTQTLINAGVKYGRPDIWPVILKRVGKDNFQKMTSEKKFEIREKIAASIGCKPWGGNFPGVVMIAIKEYLDQ